MILGSSGQQWVPRLAVMVTPKTTSITISSVLLLCVEMRSIMKPSVKQEVKLVLLLQCTPLSPVSQSNSVFPYHLCHSPTVCQAGWRCWDFSQGGKRGSASLWILWWSFLSGFFFSFFLFFSKKPEDISRVKENDIVDVGN